MDTLRGHFDGSRPDDDRDDYAGEDDTGIESPPAGIGTDERRMQVRAYNFWASLLQDRNFPAIEELEPDQLPDFGPHSVLLDFSRGIEDPLVQYLGAELAKECGTDNAISRLSDVPARSLLSRITDHYLQIIANQAPIGFEAEFVNQRGATILYRGILLPFSSDDDTIDFIYGVINWKEMADQATTDELLLEIDQALEEASLSETPAAAGGSVTDWADGPGAEVADLPLVDFSDEDFEDFDDDPLPQPLFGMDVEALLEDEDEDEEFEDEVAESRFASLLGASPKPSGAYVPDEDGEEDGQGESSGIDDAWAEVSDAADEYEEPLELTALATEEFAEEDEVEPALSPEADDSFGEEPFEPEMALEAAPVDENDQSPLGLYDCLAAARELAQAARSSEDRSRAALYDAVGRAYDVSIAALEEPEEFAELVADNGLTVQDRAPMTPVVKLVFGADYDKTRLTEYAAVLTYAHRTGIARGALADHLRRADGGLKGVVQAERRLRREETGKPVEPANGPREAIAKKLRTMEPRGFGDIAPDGQEFALVMIRRLETGEIVILGEVPEDVALIERAARRLIG
ncbi:MAG: hypothetical protein KJZ64_07695 [Sphingomonadaceae bacterium]|nr:hypothetical protein [Sphingomonadaceae bacterium]